MTLVCASTQTDTPFPELLVRSYETLLTHEEVVDLDHLSQSLSEAVHTAASAFNRLIRTRICEVELAFEGTLRAFTVPSHAARGVAQAIRLWQAQRTQIHEWLTAPRRRESVWDPCVLLWEAADVIEALSRALETEIRPFLFQDDSVHRSQQLAPTTSPMNSSAPVAVDGISNSLPFPPSAPTLAAHSSADALDQLDVLRRAVVTEIDRGASTLFKDICLETARSCNEAFESFLDRTPVAKQEALIDNLQKAFDRVAKAARLTRGDIVTSSSQVIESGIEVLREVVAKVHARVREARRAKEFVQRPRDAAHALRISGRVKREREIGETVLPAPPPVVVQPSADALPAPSSPPSDESDEPPRRYNIFNLFGVL